MNSIFVHCLLMHNCCDKDMHPSLKTTSNFINSLLSLLIQIHVRISHIVVEKYHNCWNASRKTSHVLLCCQSRYGDGGFNPRLVGIASYDPPLAMGKGQCSRSGIFLSTNHRIERSAVGSVKKIDIRHRLLAPRWCWLPIEIIRRVTPGV